MWIFYKMITWMKKEIKNVLIVGISSLLILEYVHIAARNMIKNIDIPHPS